MRAIRDSFGVHPIAPLRGPQPCCQAPDRRFKTKAPSAAAWPCVTLLWGLPIPFVFRTVSTFWCARRVLAVCMSACHGHPGPPDSVPFFLTHDYVRLFSRSLHYRARLYFHFRSPERSIPARTGLSTQPPGHTVMVPSTTKISFETSH